MNISNPTFQGKIMITGPESYLSNIAGHILRASQEFSSDGEKYLGQKYPIRGYMLFDRQNMLFTTDQDMVEFSKYKKSEVQLYKTLVGKPIAEQMSAPLQYFKENIEQFLGSIPVVPAKDVRRAIKEKTFDFRELSILA